MREGGREVGREDEGGREGGTTINCLHFFTEPIILTDYNTLWSSGKPHPLSMLVEKCTTYWPTLASVPYIY